MGCRRLAGLALAGLLTLSGSAALAQAPQSGLWSGPAVSCSDAAQSSEQLNGPQLFRAAADCARQGREADALFLQIAGQIRSQTDMTLLRPRDAVDERAAAQLYQSIFVHLGDAGPQHLYQDRALISAVFERVARWQPAFPTGYSPGWNYRARERHSLYPTIAGEIAEHRLAQLRDYAALAQDPHYAALEKEAKAIQARHPRGLPAGSEDYKRFMQLYREMEGISRDRNTHQRALAKKQSVLANLPPELDEDVEQVFAGYNGPAKSGNWTFTSAKDVRSSWVARALTEAQLQDVLEKIDFEKQVLVVVYFGRRTTATGTAYVSQASYDAAELRWQVGGHLGVRANHCPQQEAVSYPFALATAPEPAGDPLSMSHSQQNFGDGCKSPVSGEATPE
jgi:hypothetical protein